jgi:hypothetical protein
VAAFKPVRECLSHIPCRSAAAPDDHLDGCALDFETTLSAAVGS